ncbi:GNAT family N-acetyltransferase [Haloparvum sedimenti]|uniref:GNAT family N-acetyltransferase n=1 Tax=Haloparvum sedimenti TaxID=1678448 RepID=UPI00071E89AC|nr:GNAT family N-acetyltransferase [Haloparvum sedimenti]
MSDDDPVSVRRARPADADAVAAFTRDTWGERHGDYVPDAFPRWVEADDPDRRTFVVTLPPEAVADAVEGDPAADPNLVDGRRVVGCIQGVLLSEWEAWGQAIRVDPAARGFGVSRHLSRAVFDWARERGATVCRNMVFSWNVAGLGQSRAVGFDPCTEFRFLQPSPDAEATPDLPVAGVAADDPDPDAAWSFWTDSDAREHLRGLSMDAEETWALSALTREELAAAAAADRLLTVRDGGVAGMSYRSYTHEREAADGSDAERITEAIYGVAAWRDAEAAAALLSEIARDAAAAGADRTRVLVAETVGVVSDAAAARVPVSDEPDFVMAADLTDPAVGRIRDDDA